MQGLQIIRVFIAYRTDLGRSAAETLHAVWYSVNVKTASILSG